MRTTAGLTLAATSMVADYSSMVTGWLALTCRAGGRGRGAGGADRARRSPSRATTVPPEARTADRSGGQDDGARAGRGAVAAGGAVATRRRGRPGSSTRPGPPGPARTSARGRRRRRARLVASVADGPRVRRVGGVSGATAGSVAGSAGRRRRGRDGASRRRRSGAGGRSSGAVSSDGAAGERPGSVGGRPQGADDRIQPAARRTVKFPSSRRSRPCGSGRAAGRDAAASVALGRAGHVGASRGRRAGDGPRIARQSTVNRDPAPARSRPSTVPPCMSTIELHDRQAQAAAAAARLVGARAAVEALEDVRQLGRVDADARVGDRRSGRRRRSRRTRRPGPCRRAA